jgi:type I restriction enzyme M protein
MRKSLGDKRKVISDDQIEHISRLYADALTAANDASPADHAKVKIFATTDFGYRRITVERPLKLRFEITEDTLAALTEAKPLAKYDQRESLLATFKPLLGTTWSTKKEAKAALHTTAAEAGLHWPPALVEKGLWASIAVSDSDGEVQMEKGEVLPNSDLRDYENVPLDQDVEQYFAREVLPQVPDAWIDHSKDKVGYEIPFTHHFYVFIPPRPLAEIDAELRALESQIQALLSEVTT